MSPSPARLLEAAQTKVANSVSKRLSIIVPTAFQERGKSIWHRTAQLLDSEAFSGHQLIVSHASVGSQRDGRFHAWLDSRCRDGRCEYVWTSRETARLSLGGIRNLGAAVADGDILLFLDVDLAVCSGFVSDLLGYLARVSGSDFAIVPCLYASSVGTRQLVTGCTFDREEVDAAFWNHRRDLLAMLASNTSTLAVSKALFTKLGGFDCRYLDHGLEDFDLLLRTSLETTDIPVPSDVLDDTRSHSPAFSSGFRSYLNILSLPVFLSGVYTVHRWHRRPVARPYYEHRDENLALLRRNVGATLERLGGRSASTDWDDLLLPDGTFDSLGVVKRLVEKSGRTALESSALFDNMPQHALHADRTWRQLKKVVREWSRRLRWPRVG